MGGKALSRKPEPKRGIAWPRWTGFRGMTVRDWRQSAYIGVHCVKINGGEEVIEREVPIILENTSVRDRPLPRFPRTVAIATARTTEDTC